MDEGIENPFYNGVRMEKFECKDLGMSCDFSVTGRTVEEVRQKALEHAQRVHTDLIKSASTPAQRAEMEKTVTKAIHHIA
jgi:predicted small metal-binding protein